VLAPDSRQAACETQTEGLTVLLIVSPARWTQGSSEVDAASTGARAAGQDRGELTYRRRRSTPPKLDSALASEMGAPRRKRTPKRLIASSGLLAQPA